MVSLSLNGLSHMVHDSVSVLKNCFCQPAATLKLNGRTFKIIKLLGEGGFSYVYLAQDPSSGRLFALKKIRCPLGSDSVKEAMKEVEAYRRFRHPNIIRCLDSCVIQDKDGDGKVVYLFLPYYSRGNLQDLVTIHVSSGTSIPEGELLGYFLGTAKAVRAMHRYTPKKTTPTGTAAGAPISYPPSGSTKSLETVVFSPSMGTSPTNSSSPTQHDLREEEDEDEEGLGKTEEEHMQAPLMGELSSHAAAQDADQHTGPAGTSSLGENKSSGKARMEPWAHRDLKPANVMLSDTNEPILMDFGSAVRARVEISSRSVALQQQDQAAEHSSMPYRAPELFDVKTGETLTEAVDIWSLGCVLYCLAYGHSPFETMDTIEQGGSMALAVMNGSWKFPAQDLAGYSDELKGLIKEMLILDPRARPTIDQVIQRTQQIIQSRPS